MAEPYSYVKSSKLKLKGKKVKSHKKHKKDKKRDREEDDDQAEKNEDTLRHGGWWEIEKFEDITGGVGMELKNMAYMEAMDNGLFSLGQSHDEGEGPTPEEVMTAIRVGETKVALKSGFDKYLSVKSDGVVVGRSDAVGSREQWEPVFQDAKLAFMGCNNCFLSADPRGNIVCVSKTAGEDEMIKMRSCSTREKKHKGDADEQGTMKDVEINYVKKFQSFQDRRLRVNSNEMSNVKEARGDGKFHEALLDRREKMKADRYCK